MRQSTQKKEGKKEKTGLAFLLRKLPSGVDTVLYVVVPRYRKALNVPNGSLNGH